MTKKINLGLLAVVVTLFLVFTLRQFFVGPPPVDANHAFDTERAFGRLERILGDETPHPVDTDQGDVVRERLLTEIRALGFDPIVRDDFHCSDGWRSVRCARVRNVMFWVGDPGADAVMIASHHDSVPAGPGAADDGAGVAASLEIASIMKTRMKQAARKRPLLVLITDGEEMGLIGASSFVDTDPLAKMIGAVVSMEARGNSGGVAMFETSTPNSNDIAVLKTDVKKASANSLSADVYAAMPNGTDVTMYLPLGVDVGNYAIGEGAAFYHTPRDNLAMLDKRSLFHMGANALSAAEALLAQEKQETESYYIYTDILGWFILKMPYVLGMVFMLAGVIASGVSFFKTPQVAAVRSAFLPLLAIVLGVGFAVGISALVATIRPEAQFASDQPWALRGAQNAAALFGAFLALLLLARPGAEKKILWAGWIWLAIAGIALSLVFKGAAILFAPALMIIAVAAIALMLGRPRLAKYTALAAVVCFAVIVVPTSALGETMLFPEHAAPFTIFLVFCFLTTIPIYMPEAGITKQAGRVVLAGIGAVAILFSAAALLVPAYSRDTPTGLSVIHVNGEQAGQSLWSISGHNPLPKVMATSAVFKSGEVNGLNGLQHHAPAPDFDTKGVSARIISNRMIDGERRVTLKVTAPDSDRVDVRLPEDADLVSIEVNATKRENPKHANFSCFGRSCRSMTITYGINENDAALKLNLTGYRYGLGAESAALLASRPDWALPQQSGDMRMVMTSIEIPEV